MKVLHCPKNWGGNPMGLVQAERSSGLDSRLVVFEKDGYGFAADECIESKFVLIKELKRWLLFLRALFFYDVIHFNAGSTIMPDLSEVNRYKHNSIRSRIYYKYIRLFTLKDLPILKFFGKKIVVTFFGDDARQGDYCIKHYKYTFAREVKVGYYLKHLDEYKRTKIGLFGKYADHIYYTNPDLMNFLPKRSKFLPYTSIFPDKIKQVKRSRNSIPLVVHAPSNREVKGTKYILDAVDKLHGEGLEFNFIMLEKKTNKDVLALLGRADLLIDQLFLGWYGTLAVEAMSFGIPAIAYIRKDDLKHVPKELADQLPVISANPDNIRTVLREYLTVKKNKLERVGKLSREYVIKWHDPVKLVEKGQIY